MSNKNTKTRHINVMKSAKKLFKEKKLVYGDSWQIMDLHYIANRIMVKCERISQVMGSEVRQVEDSVVTELTDIVNYALIALMQVKRAQKTTLESLSEQEVIALYDACVADVQAIFEKKNHDYNDAWLKMQYASLITQIKIKLLRVLNEPLLTIEKNPASATDQYIDIANYAIFAILHPEAPLS